MFSAGSRKSSSYASTDSSNSGHEAKRKLSYVSVESIPDTLIEVHVYREAYNRPRPTPVAEKPLSPSPSSVLACAADDRQRLDRSELLERKRRREEEEKRKANENELPALSPSSRPTTATEQQNTDQTCLPSLSEEESVAKQPANTVGNQDGLEKIETETAKPRSPADPHDDDPLPHLEQTSEFTDQRRRSEVCTPHEHVLSPSHSEGSTSSGSACSDKETQWNSSSGAPPVQKERPKRSSRGEQDQLDTIWKDRKAQEKCIQVGPHAVSVAKKLPPPVFGQADQVGTAPNGSRKESAPKRAKRRSTADRSEMSASSEADFSSSYSYSSWSTYSRSPSVPTNLEEDQSRGGNKYTETGVDPICIDEEAKVETILEAIEEEILNNNSTTSKKNSVTKSAESQPPAAKNAAKRRSKSRHHHRRRHRHSSMRGRGTRASAAGSTKLPPISKTGRFSKSRERAEEEEAARRNQSTQHLLRDKNKRDKSTSRNGDNGAKADHWKEPKGKSSPHRELRLKQSAMEESVGHSSFTAHSPYMQRVFPHNDSSMESSYHTSGAGHEGGRHPPRREGTAKNRQEESATSQLTRVDDPYAFLLGRHGFWGENKYLFEQLK